jgi:hypothetical protein
VESEVPTLFSILSLVCFLHSLCDCLRGTTVHADSVTSRAFALLKPLPFFSSPISPLSLLWSGRHTLTLAAPSVATGVPFSMDSNCKRRSGLACAQRDDLTHLRRTEGVSLNRYMQSVFTVPATEPIGINTDLYMILCANMGPER